MQKAGLALLLVLAGGLSARGGIYQTLEPDPIPTDPRAYLNRVDDVRTLARQQAKVEALKKEMGESPSLEQQINLGAVYLWLADYTRALEVLREAEKIAPDDFMVLGNLATAYQGSGDYFRAMTKLQQALKVWPRSHRALSRTHLEWYWRVEQSQLNWLKALYRQQVNGSRDPLDPMEAMFPGVKLFEPRGDYLVGEMSAANRAALPPDALQIMQQMVLWFPHDPHLFWNLSEMYNAHGDIPTAMRMMNELVSERRKFSTPDLLRHRRELVDANASLQAFTPEVARGLFRLTEQPGIDAGTMAYEIRRQEQSPRATANKPVPSNDGGNVTATPRFQGWQPVVVAFIAGLAIGALVVFQVMELFRWLSARRIAANAQLTGRS